MSIGALAFLSPWLLAGLLALPVIYWLLRTVPPRPKQVAFPATRILVGLENKEKTPAKTPWWLTLIRMLAAAFIIFALADPVLNPNRETALKGTGPVVVVVDNSWASAARWAERTRMIDRLISEAESRNRAVVIAPTASATKGVQFRIEPPAAARSTAAALQPQPFAPQRAETAAALEALGGSAQGASVVWLTDGIDHDGTTRAFADRLAKIGASGFAVIEAGAGAEPLALQAGVGAGGKLEATVQRADGGPRDGILHAFSVRSQRLGEAVFKMAPGATSASATFELPLELRNQVTRVEIAAERSAGAVHLLDASSQWNRIGLLSGESREQAQPLLAPLYYTQKALAPFSELVQPKDSNLAQGIETIIGQNATVMMLADIGTLDGEIKARVDEWVRKGGILVRFAGPRLEKGSDDLLPAPLRVGGRALGGALSWSTPQPLGAFPDDSLFTGLGVPADVLVTRQVLTDPSRLDSSVKVWARLKDGTPLVTAASRGAGQLILFHVTANSDWSNLPLSGLFVEMLRRIASLAQSSAPPAGNALEAGKAPQVAAAVDQSNVLAPIQTLDGYGTMKSPPPTAQAIMAAKLAETRVSADNPPGYYGSQASPRALNVMAPKMTLKPLPALPASAERRAYTSQTATPIKPTLLALALSLLFIDVVAVLLLQMGSRVWNVFRGPGRATTASLVAFVIVVGVAGQSHDSVAQTNTWPGQIEILPNAPSRPRPGLNQEQQSPFGRPSPQAQTVRPPGLGSADLQGLGATGKVTFGYVLSGDPAADQISRQGLQGLNKMLVLRTAVDPGEPVGVNIASDEIAFYPILYWPVLANARALPDPQLAKIDAYMKQGGLIVFDTRDFGQGMPSGFNLQSNGRDGSALQRLLGRLDLPRLEPVPDTHVLTKSFYLIRNFPGRWDGGQTWVEAEAPENSAQGKRAKRADGVSSVIITSNDLASAWALDANLRPIYPAVPGGETQREMAYRTGVNIVMYALTGNYKADQVHIPALLERLGQ
jgi:Domain of unknown function (DUF4159)/Aerotolerance regulator N-terminal